MRSLDGLEDRLHNPKAEVVYDILAMKSGAHLYSRLSPLLMFAIEGDGAPTDGMREVHAVLRRELETYTAEFGQLLEKDLASLNAKATQAGLTYVIVPGR